MRNNHNKLGLGSVQFGIDYGISNHKGRTTKQEVEKILATAKKNGIGIIDTAPAYGTAEEILGNCDIDSFKIVSKYVPPKNNETIQQQLVKSLKNLKKENIYGYLAHRPSEILNNSKQWEELKKLKELGLIKKIGFSLNSPQELEQLLSKKFFPDIIQVPFNYFDRRFEKLMKKLKDDNVEIHSRSTFLQGLFFVNSEELHPFFDEVKPILKQLQTQGISASSLLKFSMSKSFIDKIIIGVENNNQLISNLRDLENSNNLEDIDFNISEKILMPSNWPK